MAKTKEEKKIKLGTALLLFFLFALAVSAIIYVIANTKETSSMAKNGKSFKYVDVYENVDGTNVFATVVVVDDTEVIQDMPTSSIDSVARDVLRNSNYEELDSKEGFENYENKVKEELGLSDTADVLISDFSTGALAMQKSSETTTQTTDGKRQAIMEGLFQGMTSAN
ncbi:MAG: hypothetical protein ACK5LV_07170 [Lachnospirales bacterium]